MATAPFPINSTVKVVDTAIDGLAGIAAKLAEGAVFTAEPFLASPILDTLTDDAVEFIINAFYKEFALLVGFTIIDGQTSGEATDKDKARDALIAAQKLGDPNAIQTALQALGKASGLLTNLDGSFTPQ